MHNYRISFHLERYSFGSNCTRIYTARKLALKFRINIHDTFYPVEEISAASLRLWEVKASELFSTHLKLLPVNAISSRIFCTNYI